MDSNLLTSTPDSCDGKVAFPKLSNEASKRHYRHRSPVSRLSSSSEGSSQRDRSISPLVSRNDLTKSADTRAGRDRRELDRDSSRNHYSRNDDSYRYFHRQSSRSSRDYSRHDDYVRHDKHADEDSKYDRLSSRSGRGSRVSIHSDHPRQESDLNRSKDYSRAEKYSRDRYDSKRHRSRDKEKESPFLERQKYKDENSSLDKVGSGRRRGNSISENMDRKRRRDRDGQDEKGSYHRSLGDKKGDSTPSYEEARVHRNDSSSGRERDNDKCPLNEGYKCGLKDIDDLKSAEKERMAYDEGETDVEKESYGRVLIEQFEEKSNCKNQESQAKKLKLSGKGIDYDKDASKSSTIADEKLSSLEQAEESGGRVTMGQAHGNDVDITNDINAAKIAAMKAAELVNRNLVGAGHRYMTTEQKKKLLWGSKKSTRAEESGHCWDTALFDDRERQEKFNKLMGVKGDVKPVERKPDTQDGNGLLQAKKQQELQLDLEKQYTAGLRRRDGRTVGLGL